MNRPATLSLNTVDYPFETLVQRATSEPKKLILNPEFQRKYKWDQDGWERASKFIESCLMRIPLPSCYFAEDENGAHIVIDGVQRITTMVRFMNDEFALEGLTTFPELNGKTYSKLKKYRADLESTTIRCIILRNENPPELIAEIFARLNQGAVKLSHQEIRHALFAGSFDELLQKLSKIDLIKNFGRGRTGKSKRDARESEELVLRHFAFAEDGKSYEGNLTKFLDNYMEKAISFDKARLKELDETFTRNLDACRVVFDDAEIFSDISKTRKRQGIVYYDLLMNSLGSVDTAILSDKRDQIRNAFIELCSSSTFRKLSAGGLQSKYSINTRTTEWATKLTGAISD